MKRIIERIKRGFRYKLFRKLYWHFLKKGDNAVVAWEEACAAYNRIIDYYWFRAH